MDNSNEFDYTPKFGGGSGDVYLKLNDWSENEQTVVIRLMTPTHTRLEFRQDGDLIDSRDWDIDQIKKAIENSDIQKSQRFSWVVLVKDGDNESVAKVYEAGSGVFKKIASIANDPDWAPIHEVDLKITRRGIKKDARYDISPRPVNRGPASDDEYAIADELSLVKYVPGVMPLKKFITVFGE